MDALFRTVSSWKKISNRADQPPPPAMKKASELGAPPLPANEKTEHAEPESAPEIENLNMTLIIIYFAANAGASRRDAGKAVEMLETLCFANLMILEAASGMHQRGAKMQMTRSTDLATLSL